jgi:periplasmic protein CpxP/Spy
MNTIFKNRILSSLIVLLLLANMGAMGFFWWQRLKDDSNAIARKEGQGASAFLIDKLKFDSSQLVAYKDLLTAHQQNIKLSKDSIHLAKDAFFDLLGKDHVTEEELKTGASLAALQQEKLDRITFDFFKSVQAICTPEQKIIFKEIIKEAMRIMGRTTPPPPRPPSQENGQQQRIDDKQLRGAELQQPPRDEARLKMTMDKLNQELKLNATQQEKVKEAYAAFFKAMEKMHKNTAGEIIRPPAPPSEEEKEAREVLAKIRDQKIQAVLTAEQFIKYQELEKTMRPQQRPEGRPNDPQE